MKLYKKSSMVLGLTLGLALLVSACGSQSNPSVSSTGDSKQAKTESADKKTKLTLMIAWAEDSAAKKEEELVAKHFADKYDITFKPVDNNVEKTIKTTIAAGEPVDLAFYWPGQMDTFVNANMALDLTPYLEANNGEWKKAFADGIVDLGNYNGKTYAVSNVPVYPMLEANKDILDKAGVTLPDGPITWDEFVKALATIKEKTGITPLGMSKDWASWLPRELMYSVWPDDSKMVDFLNGKIPFTDPNVVKAFDAVKDLYDKEYVYPGKGALTTTLDQVNIAYKTGKIAIKADVNFLANQSIKDADLKNVQILTWPHMGPRSKVMGGSNGYMIPANVKHPEASVEVLKYLTSAEVLQYRVDNGQPVAIKGVKDSNPDAKRGAKDVSNFYTQKEVLTLSPKLNDYLGSKMPANYIFSGKASLEEVEKLRLEAIQQK